jgi:hypothetical protein
MIRITQEFDSIEEAVLALGRQVGQTPEQQAAPAPAAPSTRKGRADKGKLRGAYEKVRALGKEVTPAMAEAAMLITPEQINAGAVVKSAEQATAGPAGSVAVTDAGKAGTTSATPTSTPATPVPEAAPAPEVKMADVQARLTKLFNEKGLETAMQVLSRYGAQALREVKKDELPALYAHMQVVIEGGTV